MWFKENFFPYTVIVLFVLLLLGSFYRFMVLQDYIVAYEGDCDPYSESCYVDCEDDECTAEYYYTIVERMAYEVSEICGPDVSECDAAYECQAGVDFCEISFCDPEIDGEDYCEYLEESDRPVEEAEEKTKMHEEEFTEKHLNATTSVPLYEEDQELISTSSEIELANPQEL